MARVTLALLLAAVAVRFTTVPKADIERRLLAFEDTNFKRELRLRTLFEEAGCTGDNLTEQRVRHAQAPNVICTLPGSTGSVIVAGAKPESGSAAPHLRVCGVHERRIRLGGTEVLRTRTRHRGARQHKGDGESRFARPIASENRSRARRQKTRPCIIGRSWQLQTAVEYLLVRAYLAYLDEL